jgi:DNA-binding Xre family transcriptional regulator
MNDDDMKALVQEMQWVRKLLMVQMLKSGCKQKHLASALGVSNATLNRMMPKGLVKEITAKRAGNGELEQ